MATFTHTIASTKIEEKYSLRPRSGSQRIQIGRFRELSSGKGVLKSAKSRVAPLSKYRRKTANARERHRMKEINNAFETLRKTLPDFCERTACSMTKITTLKLAANYIQALSHLLEEANPRDPSYIVQQREGTQSVSSRVPHVLSTDDREKFLSKQSSTLYHHPIDASHVTSVKSSDSSSTSSPARCSLSSINDFCDVLSESSSFFDDSLDTLDDIPILQEVFSFPVLLGNDGDILLLES
ncbi:neurogenic differentiation factor 1-like [Palaemon carinicauda]|uniref:neurogenic differentiation factor 1-like n=1 Tax=Palaemon carinicauda TaxID=392227 RepID=UPI0035B669F5